MDFHGLGRNDQPLIGLCISKIEHFKRHMSHKEENCSDVPITEIHAKIPLLRLRRRLVLLLPTKIDAVT